MNILELKRSARGYFYREGGDEQNYPTALASTLGSYQGDDASRYGAAAAYAGYTPEQIASAINTSRQQGFSEADVAIGLSRFLSSPAAVAAALAANPINNASTPAPVVPAAGVAKNGPSAGQQLAAVMGKTGGGGPNVDIPITEYIEAYQSVNPDGTINRYDTQGNFVTTYTSNGSDIVGDFFAGIDSSLGLSKGLTSIGKGLEDLDNTLGLSKNAPAIVGFAASYFLPGIGQALGQSLVNAGVITGAAIPYATTIGTALAQTGVSVAQGKPLDQALGDAILSGGMSELTQAYGSRVKSAIGQITDNPIAQKAIFKAGTDVVTAVAQGKSGDQVLQGIGKSVVSTVAGEAANELVKNIPGINSLPDAAKKVVTSGIATSIQGGDGTKSMLDTALREGTNYVLDAVTSTPIAPGTAGTTGAMQGGFGPGAVTPTPTPTPAPSITDTLTKTGLQETTPSPVAGIPAETTPITQGAVTGTALPPSGGTGIKGGAADASTGTNYVTPIKGGAADASTGTNYVTPITGGAADASTGTDIESTLVANGLTSKPGETSMAQTASQTGGTNTTNADEWGDLQGAMDAATARGINAKAPTFGEAFSSWRTALGANGTFPWTDPKTGITKVFTTDYAPATVAAISANPSAEATANPKLNTYVLGKLLDSQNIKSSDFNPADLSGIEMVSFFQNYIKATPEQQSRLLNGSDASTYKVFDKLIKETAAVNPTGALAPPPYSGTGSIQEDPSTHYVDVAKAGLSLAASDLASLGVRGLQVIGGTLGLDAPTLQQTQKLLTDDKKKTLSQLVGFEKAVAGGIASGIESAATFLIGGPYASVATLTGMGANSSWLEGVEKKLSDSDNAKRTAVMTAAELVGEMLGVPGLKQVMKGIPVTGSVDEIISAFKRQGAGLLNEQASELLTTTMQFAADKFASFGLNKNATFGDYVDALKDTVVATAAGVGTSGSIATSARSLNNAIESGAATDRTLVYPSIVSTDADAPNKPVNTVSEIAAAFADTGMPITAKVLNDFATTPKSELAEKATVYADPLVTDATEAREIARELGYTNPSQQVLDSLVGPKSEAEARTELDAFLESMSSFEAGKPVNAAAAQEIVKDLGLTNMSDADAISLANKIVQSVPEDKLAPPADDFLDKPGVTTEAPPVITSAEVSKIVTDALAANPSLTPKQVADIVDNAVKTIPLGTTAADVQKIVDAAVKTIPAGPSTQDVKKIVTDALAANPSLTEVQVTKVVNDAIAKVPTGTTTADVQKIVDAAVKTIPAGPSAQDVSKAVTDATKNLATTTSVAEMERRLADAVQAAKASGLSGDAVLKTAIDKVAADQGTSAASLLSKIGTTEAALKTQFATELSGVKTQISQLGQNLSDEIQAAKDVGLAGDAALQAGLSSLSSKMGTSQTELLKQLGTTESALKTQFATQVAGLDTKFSQAIADAKASGLAGDAALSKAIATVAAAQKTDSATLLKQLGTTEAALKTQFATDIGAVKTSVADLQTKITSTIAANEAAGLTRDQATAKAVSDVANNLGTTKTDLLKQLGTTEAALSAKVATVAQDLSSQLNAQSKTFMDALVSQGMGQKEALATAIAAQNKVVAEGQATTKTAIEGLSAAQQKEVADRVAAGQKTDDAIAAVKATVSTGQAATQAAIGNLSAAQQKEVADRVAAGQATDAAIAAVKATVETGQAALESKLTEQGKNFRDALVQQGMDQSQALETAIAAQTKLVAEGQSATKTAIRELSKAQQQEVVDRVAAGQKTDEAIAAVQKVVTIGQAETETKLDAQGKSFRDALIAQGMGQQQALETAIAAQTKLVAEGQNATNLRIDELVKQGMTYQQATQKAITEMSTGFTAQLTGAEKARQEQASAWEAQRRLDLTEAEKKRDLDRKAELDRAAAAEKARQIEITNQKAREAANLKTIQKGQIRGQMQTGLQGLIGGLQQQATQMSAPGVVETVKATPGFDFGSPLNVGFFGGYESQKLPTKNEESLKIATGGYLDDLLEAIR